MKGKIVLLNPKRGMVTALTENGEYTSFEILGGYDVEIGDVISGNLESLGGETFYNQTKKEKFEVFVEDIYNTKDIALEIIS